MSELSREERKVAQLEAKKLELEIERLEHDRNIVKATPARRGEFLLRGPIEERGVHVAMEQMDIWSHRYPGQPMKVVINSQGGTVIDGFALYDFIQEVLKPRGHKIDTLSLGMAASMAGVLLQAGDTRVMGPRAWLLIHEVQGLVAGSFSEMEDDMKFNKRLQDQALDVLVERSTMTRRQIQNRWQRKDWWLSAPEALKLGFIDEIAGQELTKP